MKIKLPLKYMDLEVGDMVKVKGRMFKITKLMKKRATFGLTLQGKK